MLIVNISFPNEWYVRALVDDIGLTFCHTDVSKRYCHFCSHCGSMSLDLVLPVEMERILFQDKF